jgi:hypothetical protein
MIKLESGRIITLHSLNQTPTYDGVLEGYPNKQHNDERIERCRRHAIQTFGQHVVVLDPVRRPDIHPFYKPGNLWGPPEYLPALTCHGVFESRPVGNAPVVCSVLHIIWYQEKFALPIDPAVVESISKVNWDAIACNWED